MSFFDLRSLFSKNFCHIKKEVILFHQNERIFLNSFIKTEILLENILNTNLNNSNNYVIDLFDMNTSTYDIFKLSLKSNKIKLFEKTFKKQLFHSNTSNLSFSFNIVFNEFNKILIKLYYQIYTGWLSSITVIKYLFPSKNSINFCFDLIKKIIKKNLSNFFLTTYFYSKTKKKSCNQIFYLINHCSNFHFYSLINNFFLFSNIEDFNGNFINLLRVNNQYNIKYQIVLRKKLSIYEKKILKYIFIIGFIFKNFLLIDKKFNFKKSIKHKFISIQNLQEKSLQIFFKSFFFKITDYTFIYQNQKTLLVKNIKSIFFFFCFLNGALCDFVSISITYKKLDLIKKILNINKKLISNNKIIGCFTIDFIDYSFNKLVGFYYFKKFFKNQNNNFYFPAKNFLKESKFEKININCTIKWPLLCFISKNSIKKYQILGKYLFKLKFIEKILINTWKILQPVFRISFHGLIRASVFLNQVFLSFFKSLASYFLFNVLELNWNIFTQKVKKYKNINIIITSHEIFLTNCIIHSSLNKPKICRLITRIFAIAKLFSFFLNKFLEKNRFYTESNYNFKLEKSFNYINFVKNILIFRKTYYIQIKKLIKYLKMETKLKNCKYELNKFLNFNEFF